ncbi:MAG: hypothetical protein ACI8W7_002240 [Gammaproteobacteria bacterium]|jgi:uncharacterized protein GlcG (DUF336 family)
MKLITTLSLADAARMTDDALTAARIDSMAPLTVVVLDAGGRILVVKSEDGSGILRFDIAFGKAWGSLGMGISSRAIRDRLSARPVFQNALAAASDGRLIPVPGGVLVKDGNGSVVGAIGISGDTSERDEYCAITAIRAAGFDCEPAAPDPGWRASSLSDRPE